MHQERLLRTEAIVLHALDYAEADRILTLLTPEGKLSALAKGVRRSTSRKAGHLGLFARVRLMLARGRNLYIITQAESIEEYPGLGADLLRFTHACYAGELVQRFAQEGEDIQPVYELFSDTLQRLATEDDLRLWTRYFELQLLSYFGYRPQLFACLGCQRDIQPVENCFSREQGGLLCAQCVAEDRLTTAVSVAAQKVLRFLQTRSPSEVARLRVGSATHGEVEALLQGYLEYVLERELKSVVFLQRIRRELRATGS